MASDRQVTVAVVSWNTRDLLARCLRSLEHEGADVWVVDNASNDGSAELVKAEFPWARLVASEQNVGFGQAVNLVAESTSSDWIVAANADTAVRPGAIEALLESAERDPRAGAIAPRLCLPDGTIQHSVFAFPSLAFAFVLNSGLFHLSGELSDRYALLDRWDSSRRRRVPWAVAAFLLVRRAAWDAVGGFDDRQWMYAEDLDLGWRLRRHGWATRYEPQAIVDHQSGASTSQAFGPELAPHWQRSTYAWMLRRRGLVRTLAVAAMNFAGSGARYLAMAPAAVLLPQRFRARHSALGRWTLVHLAAITSHRELRTHA